MFTMRVGPESAEQCVCHESGHDPQLRRYMCTQNKGKIALLISTLVRPHPECWLLLALNPTLETENGKPRCVQLQTTHKISKLKIMAQEDLSKKPLGLEKV